EHEDRDSDPRQVMEGVQLRPLPSDDVEPSVGEHGRLDAVFDSERAGHPGRPPTRPVVADRAGVKVIAGLDVIDGTPQVVHLLLPKLPRFGGTAVPIFSGYAHRACSPPVGFLEDGPDERPPAPD